MRIVSLLPSATEIVYALGLGDQLVGVTHECNWPTDALTKPRVSRSLLPSGAPPAEIDALVTAAAIDGGTPTEVLDGTVLAQLEPDLILTQDLCAVCAIPAADVDTALRLLGCSSAVVSLDPSTIGDVLDGIIQVGRATDREAEATRMVAGLRARIDLVGAAVERLPRSRVFALEWGEPPFNGGHWIPEMIGLAGGEPVLAEPGRNAVRVTWEQIGAARPDVIVFTPCGYTLDAAAREGRTFLDRPELEGVELWAVDADNHFVRPGPRLVDGIEVLAKLLHPGIAGEPEASTARRLDVEPE
jgi:iron complex transport system substrate-binding protein